MKKISNQRKIKLISSCIRTIDASKGYTFDQYWYDDAEDLRYKYAWARANNLGGVGPYCLNMLAANTIPEEAVEVWSSLDEYIVL